MKGFLKSDLKYKSALNSCLSDLASFPSALGQFCQIHHLQCFCLSMGLWPPCMTFRLRTLHNWTLHESSIPSLLFVLCILYFSLLPGPQISRLILENSFSTGLLEEPVTPLHTEVCTMQACDFPRALRDFYLLCYNLVYSVKAFSIPDRCTEISFSQNWKQSFPKVNPKDMKLGGNLW